MTCGLKKGLHVYLTAAIRANPTKKFFAGLRRVYDQTRDKLAVLLDLRLDKSFTQGEYDKRRAS